MTVGEWHPLDEVRIGRVTAQAVSIFWLTQGHKGLEISSTGFKSSSAVSIWLHCRQHVATYQSIGIKVTAVNCAYWSVTDRYCFIPLVLCWKQGTVSAWFMENCSLSMMALINTSFTYGSALESVALGLTVLTPGPSAPLQHREWWLEKH